MVIVCIGRKCFYYGILTVSCLRNGLFTTYEQSEFEYGSRVVGGFPNRRIPDLPGRT
jgi:hypothetical protein